MTINTPDLQPGHVVLTYREPTSLLGKVARHRATSEHADRYPVLEYQAVSRVVHVPARAAARGAHYRVEFTDGTSSIQPIMSIGGWIERSQCYCGRPINKPGNRRCAEHD